jgi:hypothetical protein
MRFGRKGVSVLAQGALTDIRIESSPDQQHWLPEQSLPVTPNVMAVAEITGTPALRPPPRQRHGRRPHACLVEGRKPVPPPEQTG